MVGQRVRLDARTNGMTMYNDVRMIFRKTYRNRYRTVPLNLQDRTYIKRDMIFNETHQDDNCTGRRIVVLEKNYKNVCDRGTI